MALGGGASLGSASGEIVISTAQAEASLKQLQGGITNFGTSADSAFRNVATGLGLLAASRGIANVFGGMVGQAASLEATMSAVSAALGGVGTAAGITEEQFSALNDEALRIGAETSKSASEAAEAMVALARAGIDVETVLNTGAQAAVNLSEATGEGLTQSAETMASMLLLFQDMGLEGGRAADIITTAMNASNATLNEFQTGVARLAPTVTLAGLSFEEAAAAVAYFNSLGFSAAEAGSSLNSAFLAMTNPTEEAAAAMASLGISAFDLQGNFIGFPALFDNVNAALAGVTSEADRAAILTTIFGRDALDIMASGAENGGDALATLTTEMAAEGSAAEASATRMDNFAGSLEQMRGAIETASIQIGRVFLPVLRQIVDGITLVVNAFSGLPSGFQAVTGVAIVASAAVAGIAGAMVLAGPRAAAFGQALSTIRVALLGMNPLLLASAAAVALLIAAYATNFGGFADFIDGTADRIKDFGKSFREQFNMSKQNKALGKTGAIFAAIGATLDPKGVNGFSKAFYQMGKRAAVVAKSLSRVGELFGDLSDVIKDGGLAAGIDALFGDIGDKMLANIGQAVGALPRVIGSALVNFKTGFAPIDSILANLGRAFDQFGRAIENVFAGDFELAAENLGNVLGRIADVVPDVVDLAITVIGHIADFVIDTAVDIYDALKRWIFGQLGGQESGATNAAIIGHGNATGTASVSIGSIAVLIDDWIVNTASDLWTAITRAVFRFLGGTLQDVASSSGRDAAINAAQGGAIPIGAIALQIDDWIVHSAKGIWHVINETVMAAWNLLRSTAVNIGNVALEIGAFVIRGGAGIFDAVSSAVETAWGFLSQTAIEIGDVLVEAGGYVYRSSSSIRDDVAEAIAAAWALVQHLAVQLGEIIVDGTLAIGGNLKTIAADLGGWIADQLTAAGQTIVDLGTVTVDGQPVPGRGFSGDGAGGADFWTRVGDVLSAGLAVTQLGARAFAGIDPVAFVKGAGNFGRDVGIELREAVILGLRLVALIPTDAFVALVEAVAKGIAAAFVAVGAASATVVAAVHAFIRGVFAGFVFGDSTFGNFGRNFVTALQATMAAALKVGDIIGALGLSLAGFVGDIVAAIVKATVNVDASEFDGAGAAIGQALIDAVGNFIRDNWNPLDWFGGEGDPPEGLLGSTAAELFSGGGNPKKSGKVGIIQGEQLATNFAGGFRGAVRPQLQTALDDALGNLSPNIGASGLSAAGTTAGTSFGTPFGESARSKIEGALALIKPPTITAKVGLDLGETPAQRGDTSAADNAKPKTEIEQTVIPEVDADRFTRSLQQVAAFTELSMRQIVSAVQSIVAPVRQAGQTASAGYAFGIQAGMRMAVGAAQVGVSQVRAAALSIGSLFGPGFGIGQSLGFGVAAGVQSAIGAAVQAVINLVSQMMWAARFYAGIRSPSRLFAETIGLPLAQGIGVGIDSGQGIVKRSLADLIGSLVPTTFGVSPLTSQATTASLLARATPSAAMAVAGGGGNTVINQITVAPQFHGVTDTAEIERRTMSSLYQAFERADSAGVFGR